MELDEKKPRGKKGEGRSAIFKPVNLPVDVLADLKLLKNIYEVTLSKEKDKGGSPIPVKITYGQMLTHWMDNLKKIDPAVAKEFKRAKRLRATFPKDYAVDPTEGDVWEMQYFFTNDEGEELEATVDRSTGTFICSMKGFKVTADNMLLNDWSLISEAGIELSGEQARAVAQKILAHNKG